MTGSMDYENPTGEERQSNLFQNASLISKLTFSWPWELIRKGLNRPLEEIDLPELREAESSAVNRIILEEFWVKEQIAASREQRDPKLYKAILRLYFSKLWFCQPLIALTSASRIGQALALGKLVEKFDGEYSADAFIWAGTLILCTVMPLFTHHQSYLRSWFMGMQLRIAVVAAIYDKTFRLSSTGGSVSSTSGQVFNLVSNDVERFMFASLFFPYLFWGPLEALAVLGVGIVKLGWAFAAGYVLLFVFVGFQFVLSKQFAKFRSQVAGFTDERLSLVSQAISGARVMKLSGWELQFEKRIGELRQSEIQKILRASTLRASNDAVSFACNICVTIVTFLVHVQAGNALTPKDVFTTFALINLVQFTMTKFFAYGVMTVSECHTSIARIQHYLDKVEIDKPFFLKQDPSMPLISVSDVTCFWRRGVKRNWNKYLSGEDTAASTISASVTEIPGYSKGVMALENVSVDLDRGKMYCVIGGVGSAKSALLMLLAGELHPSAGCVKRQEASVAYAAQDSWVMDGTVKENILMGSNFDDERYREVVQACGLDVDIQQMVGGDETLCGSKGYQLSGGQRSRLGLARALYKDADILLLDDPLSAVDSKLGRHIFDSAIQMYSVQRGKCVVLATHQLHYVTEETCLFMCKGRLRFVGSYADCAARSNGVLATVKRLKYSRHRSVIDISSLEGIQNETKKIENKTKPTAVPPTFDAKSQQEEKIVGAVGLSTWNAYLMAMGGSLVLVSLLTLFLVGQGTLLFTIALIGRWAERPFEEQASSARLISMAVLGVAIIILSLVRSLSAFYLCIKASRRLHDAMTHAVLRSKIEFFDTNPIGRILNRFSADVGVSDDQLPACFTDSLSVGFIVLGALATAATILPFLLAAVPVVAWQFLRIRRLFVRTSREIKRLEGLARSPLFAMVSEAVSGVATIRVNGYTDYFGEKFQKVHNSHSRAYFSFVGTVRWMNYRLEGISIVFLSLASFLAVLFHKSEIFPIDPAMLGLVLSLLMQLSGLLQWFIRQSAEMTNHMVSVERMDSYAKLPSEGELALPSDENLHDWPAIGTICLKNISVRYRESLPLALSSVSFDCGGGLRVGIVGRSGSGKSTIVQALFRLTNPENGCINIDDVNIATIGLHKLRRSMSVIPQSPVLFSGYTVRQNLDPFGEHNDEELKAALGDVQMWDVIDELEDKLETVIDEGGSNFSVGQRQLLCVARSILQKNNILVLDEPTANVDARTDQLLQDAVARSFLGATVLAIAHRLDSVIEYDKIIVMGNGVVLEAGSPAELLEKGEHFAELVNETGEDMAQELRRRAMTRSHVSSTFNSYN